MKRLVVVLIIIGLFQGVSMAAESLVAILEGIQKTYGSLSGLSVPYTREVITRSMSMLGSEFKGDTASGRIYFKHPHFLRLEQKAPKPETIIANKDTLWWYVPDKKTAYEYPARDFGKELRLLSDIFRGLANVEESFQVILQDRKPSGETRIDLIPDPPWQEIDRIAVAATPDYEIRMIDIHNQLGTVTRFTLGGLTEKEAFEEGFFRFVAPEDVKLVREGSD